MKTQLRRLRRTLSAVAVLALVITVAAPDVLAQNRGRNNDQEARTSGRSATVERSASRKGTSGRTVRKTATKKTTSRTRPNGSKTTRTKSVTIQKAKPNARNPKNSGRRSSDRGTVDRDRTDRGGRATNNRNRNKNGKGTSADRDRKRNNDRGAKQAKDRRNDRVIDRNRNRRTASADRTRVGARRSTILGRRSKYRPDVRSNRNYRKYGNYYNYRNYRNSRSYRYNRRYNRYVHRASHIYVGAVWPWQLRYRRDWRPHYRYRQVVYVNVGWGSNRRTARVDVSTNYRQRIIEANDEFAEIEITLDNIDIEQDGIYLGNVDRIPNRVGKIRATVWADGAIEFDKNVFVVGDRRSGFEIIATRNYDDYLLNAYRKDHRLEVARVDLRRGRAKMVRRSRVFKPNNFRGHVPISLLPDDDRLWDYRNEVLSEYDDYGYRNRDLSIDYRTESGLDVQVRGETTLERVN
ncbi:MAG: hypothetical protein HKN13_05195 [Rhodothermales bacterium]|nr:hypothetical protein [Rhodothermales bacterium]